MKWDSKTSFPKKSEKLVTVTRSPKTCQEGYLELSRTITDMREQQIMLPKTMNNGTTQQSTVKKRKKKI